jgi:hypothetical protein
MVEKPDIIRDSGVDPQWKDDPYGGVDVSVMRELLKMTPAERFRCGVESANNLRRLLDSGRRK